MCLIKDLFPLVIHNIMRQINCLSIYYLRSNHAEKTGFRSITELQSVLEGPLVNTGFCKQFPTTQHMFRFEITHEGLINSNKIVTFKFIFLSLFLFLHHHLYFPLYFFSPHLKHHQQNSLFL